MDHLDKQEVGGEGHEDQEEDLNGIAAISTDAESDNEIARAMHTPSETIRCSTLLKRPCHLVAQFHNFSQGYLFV